MTDFNSLNGSSVRDAAGRSGRIVSITESAVNLAWMNKGLIAEEVALQRAALSKDLQVLTLKEGWKPLGAVAGLSEAKASAKLQTLAEDLNALTEKEGSEDGQYSHRSEKQRARFGKKKHSPFKNFGHIGPAAGGAGEREVSRRTQWDCTRAGNYRQRCVLLKKDAQGKLRKTKRVKYIRIKVGYKKAYNKAYKAWRVKMGW